jgi:hypothetical protein
MGEYTAQMGKDRVAMLPPVSSAWPLGEGRTGGRPSVRCEDGDHGSGWRRMVAGEEIVDDFTGIMQQGC